jgi:hypothetical protein
MGFIEGGFSCVALIGYGGGAIFNGYRSCGSGKLSILGRSGEKILVDGGEISQSYGVSGLSGVALVGYEGDACQQCQDGEDDDEFYQSEGTGSSQASGEQRHCWGGSGFGVEHEINKSKYKRYSRDRVTVNCPDFCFISLSLGLLNSYFRNINDMLKSIIHKFHSPKMP